jgi:hypothetical protein
MALPLVLFRSGDASRIETTTEDLSREGLYYISSEQFSPDEQLECEVAIPGDRMGSVPEDDLCLRFRLRVVRVVSRGPEQGFGVGCRLEDHVVHRSARELASLDCVVGL